MYDFALQTIFEFVDPHEHLFHIVSKQWLEAYRKQHGTTTASSSVVVNLNRLQYAFPHLTSKDLTRILVHSRSLESIQWIVSQGAHLPIRLFCNSVTYRQEMIIQWMMKRYRKAICFGCARSYFIRYNRVDLLREIPRGIISNIISIALKMERPLVVQWALQNGFTCEFAEYMNMARKGYTHCLRVAYRNGVIFTPAILNAAILAKQFDVIRWWIKEARLSITDQHIDLAVAHQCNELLLSVFIKNDLLVQTVS